MKAGATKPANQAPAESQAEKPSREETIKTYLPLVRFIAEKVHRRLPPGADLESLIHSGVVGLLEALDRFDPSRGVDFPVYARYRIQGEVMQCLRSLDWVSRSVRAWGRKVAAARSRLEGEFGREPTAEELSKELGIPLEEYFKIDYKLNDAIVLSLDDLSITSEEKLKKAQEEFCHSPFEDPLTLLEHKDLVEKLSSAIGGLPERERLVVTLYHHEELTLREIGEILGLSEGRICQIYTQAVSRLRQSLGLMSPTKRRSRNKGPKGAKNNKRQNI